MTALRIAIVEDEMVIAEDMKDMLVEMGYSVAFIAVSAEEARHFLTQCVPDIILIDIKLKGKESGTSLARFVNSDFDIPFIYVTSNTDKASIEEAKQTFPFGFIQKPFDERDLYAAVEIAITNYKNLHGARDNMDTNQDFIVKDSIFVRDKKFFLKIKFSEIDYIEADSNYTIVHTNNRKFFLRSTLKELEAKLPEMAFVRIHKSYIIRLEALTGINTQFVLIKGVELPIGRSYQDFILSKVNRIRS